MKTLIKSKTNSFGKIYIIFDKIGNEYELWHEDNWSQELIACGTKNDMFLKAKKYFNIIL
tara:strand:- start:68 stop:247 length:180 start_codon:yes stop_codon:yes gene_type:complete